MNTIFIKRIFPYFIVALGIIYGILPIDLIPDIPIIGWIDDIGVIGTTLLIAFILYFKNKKNIANKS